MKKKLGLNIDHVATLREARKSEYPDPVYAAGISELAGVHGITIHLREDRRHIKDNDIERLKNEVPLPLNLEMAATEEMLAIALKVKPHAVCLVPEKREELTTEGGLDAVMLEKTLTPYIKKLQDNGSRVSLFIASNIAQVEASKRTGAKVVELHTGTYAENFHSSLRGVSLELKAKADDVAIQNVEGTGLLHYVRNDDLQLLQQSATHAHNLGLEVHAGHGLNYDNVANIAAIPEIIELNIGHFLIGEAVFIGLKEAIIRMRGIIDKARSNI